MGGYAGDQTAVNVAMVAAIVAAGWIPGVLMLRFGTPRGLPVGLIMGTTLLAIGLAVLGA
jgi:hypothetical protein